MTEALMERSKEERLRRPNPWDAFDRMQEEFSRVWSNSWPFLGGLPGRLMLEAAVDWIPRLDMYEKDNHLIVKIDLPGTNKEDIQVSLDKGDLVVRGETKTRSEANKGDSYRLERAAGQFYRRVSLPFQTEAGGIEADFKDGVLEVRIPKPVGEKKPQPQKVAIR